MATITRTNVVAATTTTTVPEEEVDSGLIDTTGLRILGENGTAEWTAEGVGDSRVVLFNAVRDTTEEQVIEMVEHVLRQAYEKQDRGGLLDLFLLAFATRNCRGGKGEKKLFYHMLVRMYREFPVTVVRTLELVPHYGYWKDLQNILGLIAGDDDVFSPLKDRIFQLYAEELIKNQMEIAVAEEENRVPKISLCAKYVPKEKRSVDKKLGFVQQMCRLLFPEQFKKFDKLKSQDKRRRLNWCKMQYRKMVSKQNKLLDVPEIKMCAHRWQEINFQRVASLCLNRNRKAFLNEKLKEVPEGTEQDTGNRHPTDQDRIECRNHLIGTMVDPSKINAGQLFPHELTQKAYNTYNMSTIDQRLLDAQWNSLVESVKETFMEYAEVEGGINLGNLVALVDVSGSMTGTPMDVAVALGIMVSELANPVFRDKFLTFSARPQWFDLSGYSSIIEKVQATRRAPWQMNTNFELAIDEILTLVERNRLPQEEVPNLIVFSDMQFDAATDKKSKWETSHERIVRKFHYLGMKICGQPYEPPTIIYWNLRQTHGHVVQADTPGTRMLSGFSPAMLKLLLKGDDPEQEVEREVNVVQADGSIKVVKVKGKVTPYETMRQALDDPLYDPVRKVVLDAGELF